MDSWRSQWIVLPAAAVPMDVSRFGVRVRLQVGKSMVITWEVCNVTAVLGATCSMLVLSQARTTVHSLIWIATFAPEAVTILLAQLFDDLLKPLGETQSFILFKFRIFLLVVKLLHLISLAWQTLLEIIAHSSLAFFLPALLDQWSPEDINGANSITSLKGLQRPDCAPPLTLGSALFALRPGALAILFFRDLLSLLMVFELLSGFADFPFLLAVHPNTTTIIFHIDLDRRRPRAFGLPKHAATLSCFLLQTLSTLERCFFARFRGRVVKSHGKVVIFLVCHFGVWVNDPDCLPS
ncbi:hypothetical protein KC323_g177 [Hortaea werneckii]|nr:hypothetical protein KC323_g177 [Hortaea werneckii]KAI7360232.1 hypothetical protein KC320_g120 [Hortaea werneckii]